MGDSSSTSSDDGQFSVLGLTLADVQLKESQAGLSRRSGPSVIQDDPLKRVENLVWIKSNTYYKEALDDWEQQKRLFGVKLERREKRAEELNNQVYNLVGFFSVFQGVILTAVTQLNSQASSSRPLCNKVWYPFALSLLAASAAIIGIVLKFIALEKANRSIQTFKRNIAEAERRQAQLQNLGAEFVFKNLPLKRDPSPSTLDRLFTRIAVIIGLIVFTGVFCLSYFAILCDKAVPE